MEEWPTYEDMTVEHLGDRADEVDLALFRAACRYYQKHANCSAREATIHVRGSGNWRATAQELLGFVSYEVARASVLPGESARAAG